MTRSPPLTPPRGSRRTEDPRQRHAPREDPRPQTAAETTAKQARGESLFGFCLANHGTTMANGDDDPVRNAKNAMLCVHFEPRRPQPTIMAVAPTSSSGCLHFEVSVSVGT
ncbi:hypothetical protein THAOC_20620 [Thalassiosira oceanica]|uniref:Uncharacterized protein n=1 Tax=Thalassiosira oceanica TaxID=159749 RepID=K0RZJ6_THAOC|nr:hypothetical protein THAOC_20620 [Thalassiosira oceanica]|eukprot:EJK59193.1 hypothetical protein THAOC_20620 [Thalassiosira oceanica]